MKKDVTVTKGQRATIDLVKGIIAECGMSIYAVHGAYARTDCDYVAIPNGAILQHSNPEDFLLIRPIPNGKVSMRPYMRGNMLVYEQMKQRVKSIRRPLPVAIVCSRHHLPHAPKWAVDWTSFISSADATQYRCEFVDT